MAGQAGAGHAMAHIGGDDALPQLPLLQGRIRHRDAGMPAGEPGQPWLPAFDRGRRHDIGRGCRHKPSPPVGGKPGAGRQQQRAIAQRILHRGCIDPRHWQLSGKMT